MTTDFASLPLAPKETPELEKMLIEHERLCMEDLRKAFVAEDASRAIEPVTARILASRKALLSMLDAGAESSRIAPTADFKELLDRLIAIASVWRAIQNGESLLRASRKAVEGYVARIRADAEQWEREARLAALQRDDWNRAARDTESRRLNTEASLAAVGRENNSLRAELASLRGSPDSL